MFPIFNSKVGFAVALNISQVQHIFFPGLVVIFIGKLYLKYVKSSPFDSIFLLSLFHVKNPYRTNFLWIYHA